MPAPRPSDRFSGHTSNGVNVRSTLSTAWRPSSCFSDLPELVGLSTESVDPDLRAAIRSDVSELLVAHRRVLQDWIQHTQTEFLTEALGLGVGKPNGDCLPPSSWREHGKAQGPAASAAASFGSQPGPPVLDGIGPRPPPPVVERSAEWQSEPAALVVHDVAAHPSSVEPSAGSERPVLLSQKSNVESIPDHFSLPMMNASENPHVKHLRKEKNSVMGYAFGKKSHANLKKVDAKIHCIEELAESNAFKVFSAALIFSNTIFIGIEVDTSMGRALERPPVDMPTWFRDVNFVFCMAFTVELLIRIFAYRSRFFIGVDWRWNLFDFLMVGSSLVEEFLGSGSNLSSIRILRVLRVVRTLRIIRIVNFFRNLRLMVCCIFNSLMSLMWALLLLLMTMYLFSIVCVQGASEFLREKGLDTQPVNEFPSGSRGDKMGDEEIWAGLNLQYSSVLRSLFTLLMAISGGTDWYEAVRPLMTIHIIYAPVFASYVLFVMFGVLNVLSAVFVEHAFDVRDRDLLIQAETERTKDFMTDMSELFKEADSDRSGNLTWEEMQEYLKDERVSMYMSTHQLDVSDVAFMFKVLDADQTGEVALEEFVLGCFRLKGHARCLDVLRLSGSLHELRSQVDDLQRNTTTLFGTSPAVRSSQKVLEFTGQQVAVPPPSI